MSSLLLHLHITARTWATDVRDRLDGEAGEGVISTAIAVLIMALIGAAMWVIFNGMFEGASQKADTAVKSIGAGG